MAHKIAGQRSPGRLARLTLHCKVLYHIAEPTASRELRMSMKALHALATLAIGVTFGIVWLKAFWNDPRRVPAAVIAAPLAAGVLGLGPWIAYDFSVNHLAAAFSLMQAVFNAGVTAALLYRRGAATGAPATA